MLRVTILKRTTKRKGTIKLRFRAVDGRAVQMYYRSGIIIDVAILDKINDDGEAKKGVKVIDGDLMEAIRKTIGTIRHAYDNMKREGKVLATENLQREVDNLLDEPAASTQKPETMQERFARYIDESFTNGSFGTLRKAANKVMQRALERFLHIKGRQFVTPKEFDAEMVVSFSDFIRNEYEYVSKWPRLYDKVILRDIPTEQRKDSTVSARMKILRAFFSTLQQREEITKSPFATIDKTTKKAILHEEYDVPVSLTLAELDEIRETDVSEELQETKAAFLLQSSTGVRIGDFRRLTMANICVSPEGVPYVQYVPTKTARISREPVQTPLIPTAVEIINQYQFAFSILRNISGKDGFNQRIKKLLKICNLNRPCAIYDEKERQTMFKPLYEIASSKLGRKTFVNLTASCQIDMYAGGLHKRSSDAVERYAHIDLEERYRLFCYAFGESETKVDENLHPIKKPKQETDRISKIVKGLSEQERKKLLQLLTDNQ